MGMNLELNSFKKSFALVLSLVIFFFVLSSSFNVANAADVDVKDLASTEKFQEKQAVVEELLVFENGTYHIDKASAEGKLTDYEVDQINTFFQNLDPELLKKIQSGAPTTGEISTYVLPVVVVAFLGTLAVFVGWELASSITADFYKWGVTSACKKWKHVKVVKSFCAANDYIK